MIRGPEQKSDLRLDDDRHGNTPDECVNCPYIPIELDTYLSVPSAVIIYPSRCNQPISPECACISAKHVNMFVLSCRRSSFHNKSCFYIILMSFFKSKMIMYRHEVMLPVRIKFETPIGRLHMHHGSQFRWGLDCDASASACCRVVTL